MNEHIEKLLSTTPDDFEQQLFLCERELHLLEGAARLNASVAQTLDKALDAALDEEAADSRAAVQQVRRCRVDAIDEQLTRIFGQLHAMHALYKVKAL